MKNNSRAKVRTAIVAAMSGIAIIFVAICAGVSCLGCGAACVIVRSNEASNRRAFEHMKELFADELEEYDGLFTAEKATHNDSSGIYDYYFSYYGDMYDFVPDCIDFCNDVPKNEHMPRDELHFSCGQKLYWRFDRVNGWFSTNVYMEDYSVIENFKEKCSLIMTLSKFTKEQQEHLKAIQNDYSFEIVLQ